MKLTFYGHATMKQAVTQLNPVQLPFHELIIMLHGDNHYMIDGKDVILQDKDIAYIPLGHTRARKASAENAEYLSIHFTGDEPLPFPVKMSKQAGGCIPQLIASADYIYQKFPRDDLSLLQEWFCFLINYIKKDLSRPQESKYVKKMKQYMVDHLYAPFQVKELAAHIFMSPSYCHAVFKRETGKPLMTYFNELRLQEAKNLIAMGEQSLTDIVDALCFYDYNYFSRTFKKHFGITPAQYKKQLYNPS